MKEIEYGKKYLISCYNYESEGIYLGEKKKKNLMNRHLFMIQHSSMKGEEPVVIGCRDFIIKEDNKLETIAATMYFPKLSKKEREYLVELSKKYWKPENKSL